MHLNKRNLALNPPDYIVSAGIMGTPIKYKWNTDLGLKFFAARDINIPLFDAINISSHKAKMGLATALPSGLFGDLKAKLILKMLSLELRQHGPVLLIQTTSRTCPMR